MEKLDTQRIQTGTTFKYMPKLTTKEQGAVLAVHLLAYTLDGALSKQEKRLWRDMVDACDTSAENKVQPIWTATELITRCPQRLVVPAKVLSCEA